MKKKTRQKPAPPVQNVKEKTQEAVKRKSAPRIKITPAMIIGILIGLGVIVIGFFYGIDTGEYVGYIVGFLGICLVGLVIVISMSYDTR